MPKEYIIRKKAIQILEGMGWVCWYAPKVRWKQTDVFGIIDVLALRGKEKKNIQLTTLPNVSAKRKKIFNFCTTFKVEIPVEIWAWCDKKKCFKKERVNYKLGDKYLGGAQRIKRA